jgi:hypothetical protein
VNLRPANSSANQRVTATLLSQTAALSSEPGFYNLPAAVADAIRVSHTDNRSLPELIFKHYHEA